MKDNKSLGTRFPKLAAEWHPTKNEELTPFDVRPSHRKKVWWLCEEKKHPFCSSITNRVYLDRGCPFCSGQKVCKDNCLATLNPLLAAEWHPTKNGELTPYDTTVKSSKKVWWKCEKGDDHSWKESISNRKGCPFCSNHKVCMDNCLASITPNVAKQWHPHKNNMTSFHVFPFSKEIVWWKCVNNHEWQESILKLQQREGRCPYCPSPKIKRVRVNKEYSLGTLYPKLTNEWHPTKNQKTAFEMTPYSNQTAIWFCEEGHEWKATIKSRTRGNGCPECAKGLRTSFYEQSFYFYINQFKNTEVKNGEEVLGLSADICINNKIIIEYDGFFHKSRKKNDEKKNKKWTNNNFIVYRIRERNLPILQPEEGLIIYEVNPKDLNDIEECIKKLLKKISAQLNTTYNHIKVAISRDEYVIRELMRTNKKERSLFNKYPDIAKEWNYLKNGKLLPSHFAAHSAISVWWVCPKGHEYLSRIDKRSYGRGCPYCSHKKISPEKSLAIKKPDVAKTWHPTKNGKTTPYDIFPKSHSIAWWICEKGHSFDMQISSRINADFCPYCDGKRVSSDTSLAARFSELIEEWHPIKNGEKTPFTIKPFSNKKVWWLCKNGHEWLSTSNNRCKGNGCPKC